ncbi:MAG TPA: hypothetical protein PLE82_05045 [Saccharofermentans sp.]|nr:hypothetical protein [Saccharofermentans sp.]
MKTHEEVENINSSLYLLRLALIEAGITKYKLVYIDSDEVVVLNDNACVNVHMDSVEATLRDVMRAIIKEEERC